MSQLIKLRRKIKSIKTTHKVTYAMRLIAMSIYAKLEKTNTPINYYNKTIQNIFDNTLNYLPDWDNPILLPKDYLDSTPLVILIGSSKGFCGGFNAELFRFFKRDFFAEEHQKPNFITIGIKATKFLSEEECGKGKIIYNYDTLNSQNYLFITKELMKIITKRQNPFSSITVYSNHFLNFFIQKPKKSTVTPFKKITENSKQPPKDPDSIIWEGDQNKIMDSLALNYLQSSILNLVFQSLLAEQAARFLAMDNATNNAEKFLTSLTTTYNKARQSLITKELIELSTSFTAFNG